MPTIPEHREALYILAAQLDCPALADIADDLKRRPSKGRAPKTSRPMTDSLAADIRAFKHANPHLSYAAIGNVFNVNIGRVGEALRGKRT